MNWDELPISREQAGVVGLVLLLVVSAAALPMMFAPGSPGAQDADAGTTYTPDSAPSTPGEEATLADSQLHNVPSSHMRSDLDTGGPPPLDHVSASKGSQTMTVRTMTVRGDAAIELSDDRTHEGRWVGVPTGWLKKATGDVPEAAIITHESGDEYVAPIRVQDGEGRFYVREFSSNTVTFEGSYNLTADPAEDGTTITYNITDLDSASDPNVTMTGHTATEMDNVTGTTTPGQTTGIGVGGNLAPTNQAGTGDPELTMTGTTRWYNKSISPTSVDTGAEILITDVPETAETLKLHFNDGHASSTESETVYLNEGDTRDSTIGGNDVGQCKGAYSGARWCTVDVSSLDTTASGQVTLEMDASNDGAHIEDEIRLESKPPADITVSDDQGNSANFGTFTAGETKSATLGLSTASSSLDFSGSDGNLEYHLEMQERTQTVDPNVTVNGNTLSHTGPLADGETATFTGSSTWLSSGENTIDVDVGDGSLSADAPTPAVTVDYQHDTTDQVTTSYTDEQWVSRYDISRTYASSRENATLTIPFNSDRVVGIRDLDMQTNESGTWNNVGEENYQLEGTTLTVDMTGAYGGEIPAGTDMRVRANATKVDVVNGNITVVSSSDSDDPMSTQVQVDDASDGFRIETDESRIHHAVDASYAEGAYWVADQQGQRIHMPNAAAEDMLTIETIPVSAKPQTDDVHVTVPNPSDAEPEFVVAPGQEGGDTVDYTLETADDGTSYVLWSVDDEVVRDSGTANSPLTLSDDDSNETLQFLIDDGGGSGSFGGGGGSGEGGGGVLPGGSGNPQWIPLIGIALALGALVVVSRNDDSVTNAGSGAASRLESGFGGIPIVGPAVGRLAAGATQSVAQLGQAMLGNKTIATALGGAVVFGAIQGGIIALPAGSMVVIVVAFVALGSFVGLREYGDEFDLRVWAGVVTATAVTAIVIVSDSDPVAAITNSEVFPLVALGGLYLAYQAVQTLRQWSSTPETQQTIVVEGATREEER